MIVGHDRAIADWERAWRSGRMPHAWLIAGQRGVGKASFARAAAAKALADAAGPAPDGFAVPLDHPTARLIAAGSHPDYRLLERLERPTGGLARNISVDQVRSLAELFTVTPSLSPWRAIVIDSADDLEASAANALLKMLEEPPANTLFFLVSHAPGRLLATLRSRCRRLDLHPLAGDAMTSLLDQWFPDMGEAGRAQLSRFANGSPGRAMEAANLDLAGLEKEAVAIIQEGDRDNARRSALANALSGKAAAERYAAFLSLVPSLIAREARANPGLSRRANAAYDRARELSVLAPRLSLDPGFTVFQLGGVLASLAPPSLKG